MRYYNVEKLEDKDYYPIYEVVLALPEDWEEQGIVRREEDLGEGVEVWYEAAVTIPNPDNLYTLDASDMDIGTYGTRHAGEVIYKDEGGKYFISLRFVEIDRSKYFVAHHGDEYIVVMDGMIKVLSSLSAFRTWLHPYKPTQEIAQDDEMKPLAGQDYIRELVGFGNGTLDLMNITDLNKHFDIPVYLDPDKPVYRGDDPNSMYQLSYTEKKNINAYIKHKEKKLAEQHRVKIATTKNTLKRLYGEMKTIPKLKAFGKRTVLFGTEGEYMLDMDAKVLYITDNVIYKDLGDYDEAVVADFKKMQPNVDELIALIALGTATPSKMQYTALIGSTNTGKTFISEALGARGWKERLTFKAVTKGAEISETDAAKFAGILLVDDIKQGNMPEVQGYKTFHDRGLNVGTYTKRRSLEVKHTIITKVDMGILDTANEEYANRTTVFELEDTPMETSSLFQEMGGKNYIDELGRYIRHTFKEYYDSNDYKLQGKLEQKYRLKTSESLHGILLEEMAADPAKYFKEVIHKDGLDYIPASVASNVEQLKKTAPKFIEDKGALFKEFRDNYCKRSSLVCHGMVLKIVSQAA